MTKFRNIQIAFFILCLSLIHGSFIDLFSKEINPLFYEISIGNSRVYLLGSIHYGKKEWYPLPEKMLKAFEESNYLVTEIDLNSIQPNLFARYALAQDGISLDEKLKPANYEKITQIFTSMGFQENMLSMFRPWFAAILYQTNQILTQDSLSPENGIDIYFSQQAAEKSKEILEIENAESQIKLLTEFDNFADLLIESTDEESENNDMNQLITAWEKGDAEAIDLQINKSVQNFPELLGIMTKLLDIRNIGMADKIEEYLQTGETYFIVIGAGHLVSQKGIIQLLNKKNKYKINRL
ncbi:MAG: hypothetical protein A2X64_07795 [Ignavibacteria bacterium GWF2_33_9]|nr:MAG: hypothetical protein A2X64_07795 [Ignavibacteria bacterium GWF2_33_9]